MKIQNAAHTTKATSIIAGFSSIQETNLSLTHYKLPDVHELNIHKKAKEPRMQQFSSSFFPDESGQKLRSRK